MYLYGRKFTILTDHRPLEYILGPTKAIPTLSAQRLQCWAIELAAFTYDLKYIPAKDNLLADALSRLPLPEEGTPESSVYQVEELWLEGLPVMSQEVKECTRRNPVLSRVVDYLRNGWPEELDDEQLKPFYARRYELSLEQGCIMWGLRVVIPDSLQERVLEEIHLAHPGIVRMKELARSHIWWPSIDRDIEFTARKCAQCQQVKGLPPVAPVMPWIWPGAPWHRIHVDYAEVDGLDFLVIIDAHSKWPEVRLMTSTTAEATIRELRDIFSKYGLPNQLVSDNGPQFRSELFKQFLAMNGIKQILVAPYHPASNGAAERLVQTFKRSYLASSGDTHKRLANFLLTYRTTTHATTGVRPDQLFFGRELRTRLSLIRPQVRDYVEEKQAKMIKNSLGLREFYPGENVVVKDMRKNHTWWPGVIAERSGPKSYVITLPDGRVWKRHVDHLRRATHVPSEDPIPSEVYTPLAPGTLPSAPLVLPNAEANIPEPLDKSSSDNQPVPTELPPPMVQAPETPEIPLRRSTRERKAPDRLDL